MSTSTSTSISASTSTVSFDAIKALGLKGYNRNAATIIRNAGGYVPENASMELLTFAASVVQNANVATKAGRATALALAMIEDSGEHTQLKSPSGKPFKSCTELFSALFPSLASSTIRNYLNAGRTIYLPAAKGELEPELMILNDLEPGTALSACAALNDSAARAKLPSCIKEAQGNAKRLSQSMLKSAVKSARAADNKSDTESSASTSGNARTEPTAESDERNARKAELEAMRVTIKHLFRPDVSDGDIHLLITESDVKAYVTLLTECANNPEKAQMFVQSFLLATPLN